MSASKAEDQIHILCSIYVHCRCTFYPCSYCTLYAVVGIFVASESTIEEAYTKKHFFANLAIHRPTEKNGKLYALVP